MIFINQTLMGKFLYHGEIREYCPLRIYNENILHIYDIDTAATMAGKYFETLCLGSSIDGIQTNDLPRKHPKKGQTIGDKTINQIRIEKQHLIFESVKTKYQIAIQKGINTQVKIFKRYSNNDDIILHGELDIFPTAILLPKSGYKLSIIDLKLTGHFTDFGERCWLTPANMDHHQAYMYHYLVRDIDIELNQQLNPNTLLPELITPGIINQINAENVIFFYWVFNYKEKDLINKFIPIYWTPTNKAEFFESVRKVINEYNQNEKYGWNRTVPSYPNCKYCQNKDCTDRYIVPEQTYEETGHFDSIDFL